MDIYGIRTLILELEQSQNFHIYTGKRPAGRQTSSKIS